MFLPLLIIISACNWNVLVDTFTIGGLFHDDNYQSEMAFKYAIARKNKFSNDIQFDTKIYRVNETDSFAVKKIVCEMVSANDGVVAIFGPESHFVSPMVESICTNLGIPYLSTNYYYKTSLTSHTALNMYPDPELLAVGLATIVRNLNWKSYIIIYQNIDSLVKLQDVLKISTHDSTPVTIRQLSDNNDQRKLFKELKQSKETNIILDCNKELVIDILLQAKEEGMLEDFHSYLITALDAHTLDYTVLETGTNITMIRLVDPANSQVHNMVRDWELGEQNDRHISTSLLESEVTAEAALMYDAVSFFVMRFREFHLTEHIRSRPLTCEAPEVWQNGYTLVTYMKDKSMLHGLTGSVKFNKFGRRSQFTLEVAEVTSGNIDTTVTWTPDYPYILNFTRMERKWIQKFLQEFERKDVIVSSRIGAPYLKECEWLTGNNRYCGYSRDLMDAISRQLNFTYKFKLTTDGAYGDYDAKTKSWNGLIGDVIQREAQLAISDLTITHQRRAVVDFSLPFMTLGVGILHSKPKTKQINVFPVMELDSSAWMYVMSAYISVTIAMYLIARMAPGDWEKTHPHNKPPEKLENKWTLKNCLWLTFSSTAQGCDTFPKGISSRMATSLWWFLIIMCIASYLSNLFVYLNNTKTSPRIDGFESLASQHYIKYGVVNGSSTQTFFKESKDPIYARMWTQMIEARPSVFVSSNEEGIQRVLAAKNQEYAFLIETPSLEYAMRKYCALRLVGNTITTHSYGIAMPLNAPYRSAINHAILKLQKDGLPNFLKIWWWEERNESCDEYLEDDAQLKLANFGEIFTILFMGVSIAMLFSFVDFLWNVRFVSLEQKISYKEAFVLEIKFALKFWITKKKKNLIKSKESLNDDQETQL